jgi:hypothetical protein
MKKAKKSSISDEYLHDLLQAGASYTAVITFFKPEKPAAVKPGKKTEKKEIEKTESNPNGLPEFPYGHN